MSKDAKSKFEVFANTTKLPVDAKQMSVYAKLEVNKRNEKVDVEHIRAEMNRTWKRRDGANTSNGGITSPKRSSGHTSSN